MLYVTYLVCHSEQRFNHYEGLCAFNVGWDRAKRPSECEWYAPGTDKEDPAYNGEFFYRAPYTGA